MTTPRYEPIALANYFIEKYGGDEGLQHMKLQKLVYLAYGWWLSHFDEPLTTEPPQVWKYGPVFDPIYQAFRTHGRTPIKKPYDPAFFSDDPPRINDDDKETQSLLDWVWERYGHLSSVQLSNITHQPDTPWSVMVEDNGYKIPYNLPMDAEVIKKHYRELGARVFTK